ncbi:hypothetical protein [Amycolatopsis taiwanensis]|uniref:hypothetical protein n=1 Tax=Amycolatopsis taiwanensis TaxID=342230 RepID=UPI00047F51E0|nr:hypothetical protein [Amycolatopsis taiwanensis]
MDHDHWEVEEVRRSGALEKDRLREDEDLRRAMVGNDGHSQFHFTGSATPRNRNRWASFKAQMETSLAGNDQWRQLIRLWLDDIAERRPDDDVVLHIFNSCDLMQTVVFGWPDRLIDYAPDVVRASSDKDHDTFCTVKGTLYWDGHHCRTSASLCAWSIKTHVDGNPPSTVV